MPACLNSRNARNDHNRQVQIIVNTDGDVRLEALASQIDQVKRPPVDQWQPEREGLIDIVIRRDGSWVHEGSVIHRQPLVRLFASILRLDDERYFLVTPVEKLEITVEDAPFAATSMEVIHPGTPDQSLAFTTNVGDQVICDESHPLSVQYSVDGEPSPYVVVRSRLSALLTRSVWIELAELATEQDGVAGVHSRGTFFALSA